MVLKGGRFYRKMGEKVGLKFEIITRQCVLLMVMVGEVT